jgi:uncharacterized protein
MNITQIVRRESNITRFVFCPLSYVLCPSLPFAIFHLPSLLYLLMQLSLTVLPETFAVCRFAPDDAVPAWATTSSIFSITRTTDELSIVAPKAATPADIRAERGWRALKIAGPIDFALTGVLASVLQPLADAHIGIFAISTFDTDYILVRAESLESALAALRDAGHTVHA